MNDENNENDLNGFIKKYGGAVIGGLVALVLCFTQLYRVLVCMAIVISGILIGNYVQKNKPNVKEKLKDFIDKF